MSPELQQLTLPTALLDFTHPAIEGLVAARGWGALSEYERIGAVYDFVRDEIAFGYNESDDLPASRVLADGIGQCNTKGTLLMALLRAVGIPCRFHGFTIDKALQKGAITGVAYLLAPRQHHPQLGRGVVRRSMGEPARAPAGIRRLRVVGMVPA